MKKITFKQKLYNFWQNEKFRKIRDFTLFISLGINLLIFILFGVVSCSIKEDKTSNDHTTQQQTQLVQHRRELNNPIIINKGDIVKIHLPSTIDLGDTYITKSVWFSTGNHGLYINLDTQNHNDNEFLTSQGSVINWISNNTNMDIKFYDYDGNRTYTMSYEYGSNGVYFNDNNDFAYVYMTYLDGNVENNYFINLFNDNGYVVEKVNKFFGFTNSWSIYDYVDSNNGLTSVEYKDNSNRFLLQSRFISNGITFKYMYFEFVIPNETNGFNIDGYYMDTSGNLVFTHSEDTYKYIFNGIYYVDLQNNVYQVASTSTATYTNNTGQSIYNTYNGLKCPIANTFYWLNDSWRTIELTGSVYTNYLESPLFAFNYDLDDDGYVVLKDQPNDNGYSYLNYSYSASSLGVSVYGDYNETIYSPIDLLSTAFSGLRNIFDIVLLPHITIGLLLFMPLVVAIIIVLFKLVKK